MTQIINSQNITIVLHRRRDSTFTQIRRTLILIAVYITGTVANVGHNAGLYCGFHHGIRGYDQ